MRGKKAKALRNKVYGDKSQKGARKYADLGNAKRKGATGTIVNAPGSLRAMYLAEKRNA